ncbi:MAG TPA: cobyric acid synthase [Terriglobales bacterium]|nr:cobyric acid synthase [Terriglobales bacterium]
MTARALMILGTASHVGKSTITAGLGRIFSDDGVRVAPFKAQNMSLNSAATPDGGEIGRAQALQAEACRVAPCVEMNPVLIKPRSDSTSQVMLLGKVWGQVSAQDYHTRRVEQLFPAVLDSYRKLASQNELILLEGAGSPAEINLREHDIVNLRMARAAGAACLLVGDIDRGGVFASLLGTMGLLEDGERELIKGFIINKFRGDKTLLQSGVEMIERRLGLPCVGIVPYLHNLNLEEEDSVAMAERPTPLKAWNASEAGSSCRTLRVGVIAFPHLSNFTDFDALAAEPSVTLAFLRNPRDVALADVLILPGTKQTLDDLDWLESEGFVPRILEHGGKKKPIVGICGGFQMLGISLHDPAGMENSGRPAEREGLKILRVRTILQKEKTTQLVKGRLCQQMPTDYSWAETQFKGYEIHLGETQREEGVPPFATVVGSADKVALEGGERYDGAVSEDRRTFGTYVHGVFDDDKFRHSFVAAARAASGLAPAEENAWVASERETQFARLANHMRASLDMKGIRGWIDLNREEN